MIKTVLTGIVALLLFIACDRDQEEISVTKDLVSGPVPKTSLDEFSGQKAYDHIVKLTSFGPRPPKSEGYEKSLKYLEAIMKEYGWATKRSSFQATTPVGKISFTNLIARYQPEGEPDWTNSPKFVIGGHLDSKPYSDKVFLGVNDSGSSTGVMLEIARVLAKNPAAALNVEFVFFDGEEAMLEDMTYELDGPRRTIRRQDGLYGSTNYAKRLAKRRKKPSLAFVLDLIGDSKVPLFVGGDSNPRAIAHSKRAVETLGLQKIVKFPRTSVLDDHVPLIVFANLPVLHLIGDFQSMPYWHKKGDTLDKISPEALGNAGKLTLQVLHQLTNQ